MRGCIIVHACGCATLDGVLVRICAQHLASRPDPAAPKHKPVPELDAWQGRRRARQDPEQAQLTREAKARARRRGPLDVPTLTVDELREQVDQLRQEER